MLKHDVNISLLVTIGGISAMLLLVVLFGVEAWYDWEVEQEFTEVWQGSVSQEVTDLKVQQRATIEAPYHWTNRAGNSAKVPIGVAMKAIVANGGNLPSTRPGT